MLSDLPEPEREASRCREAPEGGRMNRQQAYRTPPWKKQMQTLIRVGTGLIILFVIALVYLNYSAQLMRLEKLEIQGT